MSTGRRSKQPKERTLGIGEKCAKYRVTGLIGEGGMGEVYEAEDEYLGRRVALKVLSRRRVGDPSFSLGQRKEARTLASIDHPNVVRVYDAGVSDDGIVYLAMERLQGVSLGHLVWVMGALKLVDALSIGLQIVDAIRVAHEVQVIHRDLKPENVLVMQSGVAKVIDFGVALRQGGASGDLFEEPGTVQYMSPEQLHHRGARKESDVYAIGLILHEMLTGRYLFAEENGALPTADVARMCHLHIPPPSLTATAPGFDAPAIDALVMRMLAKGADERPTADEVHEALTAEYERRERQGSAAEAQLARKPSRDAHALRPISIDPARGQRAPAEARTDAQTAPLEGYRPPTSVLPFRVADTLTGAQRWPRTEPLTPRIAGAPPGDARPGGLEPGSGGRVPGLTEPWLTSVRATPVPASAELGLAEARDAAASGRQSDAGPWQHAAGPWQQAAGPWQHAAGPGQEPAAAGQDPASRSVGRVPLPAAGASTTTARRWVLAALGALCGAMLLGASLALWSRLASPRSGHDLGPIGPTPSALVGAPESASGAPMRSASASASAPAPAVELPAGPAGDASVRPPASASAEAQQRPAPPEAPSTRPAATRPAPSTAPPAPTPASTQGPPHRADRAPPRPF